MRLLVAQKSDALLVPAQAVGDDQGGQFVLVVGPDNKVEKRSIVAGPTYQSLRVIDTGVQVAERVITEGLQKVQAGMVVQPKSSRPHRCCPPICDLDPVSPGHIEISVRCWEIAGGTADHRWPRHDRMECRIG